MFFLFKKTGLAEIVQQGSARIGDSDVLVPCLWFKPTGRAAIFDQVLDGSTGSGARFLYFKKMNAVALQISRERKKIGIIFKLSDWGHLTLLAKVINSGSIVIKNISNDKVSGMEINHATQDFYQEWNNVVIVDVLRDIGKNDQEIAAIKDQFLSKLLE